MTKGHFPGVSLSEYAILLGLIGLVCIAGLSFTGDSTADLLGSASTGKAKQGMDKLVSLDFGGTGSSTGSSSTQDSPSGSGSSHEKGGLALTESFGSGSNVSSAEGSRINVGSPTISKSLEAARTFERLASESTDPALKNWYKDAAIRAYWLAGSQASFEANGGGDVNPALAEMANLMGNPGPTAERSQIYQRNSLQSISIWSQELAQRQQQFMRNSSISRAEKAEVKTLLDSVLASSETQYGNAIRNNAENSQPLIQPNPDSPEMLRFQAIVAEASMEGQLGDTPAVQASADAGLTLEAAAR